MPKAGCVIIGGGIMGCAAALRLAQAKVDVVVLERAIPGAEASSAAAGILAAQEEAQAPGALYQLAIASRGMFAALAAELRDATGVDIAHRECGLLSACFSPEDEERLERRYAWQRERGQRLRWLRGADLAAAEPGLGPRAISALSFPDDGQVEPPALLRALSQAAARAGARFVTGAHVRRVVCDAGRVAGVEVEGEQWQTPSVVIAAGSWSSLVEGTGLPPRAVRPMRGQIVELETRPAAVRGTIISPQGGYLSGRAGGRVLAGSTMEWAGFDKRVTVAGIRHVLDVAVGLIPGLAEAPVTGTWANFRPTTADQQPLIGPGPRQGLVLATGHFRNGILLAPVTAEIVRDLIVSGKTRWDLAPFSEQRLRGDHDSA